MSATQPDWPFGRLQSVGYLALLLVAIAGFYARITAEGDPGLGGWSAIGGVAALTAVATVLGWRRLLVMRRRRGLASLGRTPGGSLPPPLGRCLFGAVLVAIVALALVTGEPGVAVGLVLFACGPGMLVGGMGIVIAGIVRGKR